MAAMSPSTRRTRRGREVNVLDNVTAAPFVTNNVEPGRFAVDNCPDEMVIFARGRRSIPLTFSPDVTTMRQRMSAASSSASCLLRHPLAGGTPSAASRLLLPTRTSPRKRLTLTDSPPSSTTSGYFTPPSSTMSMMPIRTNSCPPPPLPHSATPSPDAVKWSPVSKKCHLEPEVGNIDEPADALTSLKALTKDQLLQLLTAHMTDKPEVVKDIEKLLPEPDLQHMEEQLKNLKRNIHRSLPNTRLESKTDSMAYNRVCAHLVAFKKAVHEQGKSLTEARAWKAVIDHTLMAWAYVKSTPVWDNPIHNNIRKSCFKSLASNCLTALKRRSLNAEVCSELRIKMKLMEKDSEEITAVIKQLDHIINNGNVSS